MELNTYGPLNLITKECTQLLQCTENIRREYLPYSMPQNKSQ